MADLKLTELNEETTPVDADIQYVVTDIGTTPLSKFVTWANIKATLKSYFDGIYATIANLGLLKDIQNYADSPMVITGGEITDGTNAGTFKVAALTALFRTTDSLTGDLLELSLAEQDNQTMASADTTYIISLNYNAGSPTISTVASNPYKADKRNIPIGQVMKDGSDNVHYISGGYNFQDGVEKLHIRARTLRALELASGSTIAYSGTNNFTMTEGIVYGGLNKFTLNSYNSASTQFTPVYGDGGSGFTEGAASNVIDFEHYDDGDGVLGEVGNAKYGCFWVYRHTDMAMVYVIYGTCNGSLAEAEVSQEPSKPDHLVDFGLLIGRIVAPQAGGSFADISMVSDTIFTGTAVGDHAQLSNLQGGAVGEYNHITDDELVVVQATSNTNTGDEILATGAEVDTGTDDVKYTSAKALKDSHNVPSVVPSTNGNVLTSDGTDWTSAAAASGDLFDDKTPQLGGDLEVLENDIELDEELSEDEKWSGISIHGTAGATLAVGDICFLQTSDSKWELVDGILDGTDLGFKLQLGICILAANEDAATKMLTYGKIRSAAFPAFTVGAPVYLDDTAGDLVVAQPSTTNFAIRIVGYALTAEELMFNPSNDYIVHI